MSPSRRQFPRSKQLKRRDRDIAPYLSLVSLIKVDEGERQTVELPSNT